MIKIMNIITAKSTLGSPSTKLLKPFNIVSEINPLSKVKLIPLAIPIIRITPTKSPAPLVNN